MLGTGNGELEIETEIRLMERNRVNFRDKATVLIDDWSAYIVVQRSSLMIARPGSDHRNCRDVLNKKPSCC